MYQGRARARQPVLACPLPSARTMVRQAEPVSWWIPAAFTAVEGSDERRSVLLVSRASRRRCRPDRPGSNFPQTEDTWPAGTSCRHRRRTGRRCTLAEVPYNRPGHRADRSCRRHRPSRPSRGFPSHRPDWHRRLPHHERQRRHRRSCRQIPSRPPLPCPPFPLHRQVPPLRRRQRPSCRRCRPFPRCRRPFPRCRQQLRPLRRCSHPCPGSRSRRRSSKLARERHRQTGNRRPESTVFAQPSTRPSPGVRCGQ